MKRYNIVLRYIVLHGYKYETFAQERQTVISGGDVENVGGAIL